MLQSISQLETDRRRCLPQIRPSYTNIGWAQRPNGNDDMMYGLAFRLAVVGHIGSFDWKHFGATVCARPYA